MPSSGFNCARNGPLVISNTNRLRLMQLEEVSEGVHAGGTTVLHLYGKEQWETPRKYFQT